MIPVLVINPRSDTDFTEAAQRHLTTVKSAVALERALRKTYPRTVVHVRVLAGELTETWYVYREGTWTSSD